MSGHIFISYKTEDRAYAIIVRDQLRAWGYETWMDVDRLEPGAYWANDIDHALKTAAAVVAITTPAALASRNVTNEWDMAIVKGIPFIPLLHEKCDVHYKYIDIQYLDFTLANREPVLEKLKTVLQSPHSHSKNLIDPHRDYLNALFDRINVYLSQKIIRTLVEPIKLQTEITPEAVLFEKQIEIDPLFAIGGLTQDESESIFSDFSKAFDHFDGRVLLLGLPGAGKTITLLHSGRDAVVRRINDPSQPLPILGIIPTWDAQAQSSIADWLAASYGAPPDAAKIVHDGKALLLLDGLDELGGERPVDPEKPDGERYDPRRRFVEALERLAAETTNRILVTCRPTDYEQIGEKLALRQAVTLQPLGDDQMRAYLAAQPTLMNAIQADERLREMLSTPLLLSFFAFAYEGMSEAERAELAHLQEAGDLRDKIFRKYVEERYNHEARKPNTNLLFNLQAIYDVCGALTFVKSLDWHAAENQLQMAYFIRVLPEDQIDTFIQQAIHLHLLSPNAGEGFRFLHLLLHNHFAFPFALDCLDDPGRAVRYSAAHMLGKLGDTRALDVLLTTLHDPEPDVRRSAIDALGKLRDARAVDGLLTSLHDPATDVRSNAAYVLGNLRDARAMDGLLASLHDPATDVRSNAAASLGNLEDARAVDGLLLALRDPEEDVRREAAHSLGYLGEARAVEGLMVALRDPVSGVSFRAVLALRSIGTPEALAAAETWQHKK